MSRVAVSRDVLHWAMDRSSLTEADLEPRFPKIREWLTGESLPTLEDLERLAKRTLTPLGFFFLDEPPEERLPIPHFRTVEDTHPARPSPELLQTVWTMQRRQDWLREYLRDNGEKPLPFVGSSAVHDPPVIVADRMRSALALGTEWAAEQPTWEDALKALRGAMEGAGIVVVVNGILGNNTHRKLDVNEFRGFVLVDDYAPLAFVNGADAKAAQMFTLAHELAHIFLGSSAAFDLRGMQPADDLTEQACNRIAAEFLVPEERLRSVWEAARREDDPFQALARRFKVSEIVAARRALDLRLLTREAFLDFYGRYRDESERRAARRSRGGDYYNNQYQRVGRRFASAVLQAVKNDDLSYREAFRLTDLYGRKFDEFASRIEGKGG